jgi:hypothetical protein
LTPPQPSSTIEKRDNRINEKFIFAEEAVCPFDHTHLDCHSLDIDTMDNIEGAIK